MTMLVEKYSLDHCASSPMKKRRKLLGGLKAVMSSKSVRAVRAVVGSIVAQKCGVVVYYGQWDRFTQLHPHLVLHAGESLAFRRAVASSPETFSNYFDQLE